MESYSSSSFKMKSCVGAPRCGLHPSPGYVGMGAQSPLCWLLGGCIWNLRWWLPQDLVGKVREEDGAQKKTCSCSRTKMSIPVTCSPATKSKRLPRFLFSAKDRKTQTRGCISQELVSQVWGPGSQTEAERSEMKVQTWSLWGE